MKKKRNNKKQAKVKNRADYQLLYSQKMQKQLFAFSLEDKKELLLQHSLYFNKELFNPDNRIKQGGQIRFKQMPKKLHIINETKWPIYYSSRVCQLLQHQSIDQQFLKMFFTDILLLANGIFCPQIASQQNYGYVKQIKIQEKSFSRFFLSKFHPNFSMIIKFCVQKSPIMLENLKIVQQHYQDILLICDVIKNTVAQQIKKIKDVVKHYQDKESIFRFHEIGELMPTEEAKNQKHLFVKKNPNKHRIAICDTEQTKLPNQIAFYQPLTYKPRIIQQEQANRWSYQPQQNVWFYEKRLYQEGKIKDTEQLMNEQVIERLVEFGKIKEVIKVLSKYENFKIHLTDQQREIIQIQGNVLVIGRSGTGKTTCSLLRLFCIDIIFQRNLQNYLKQKSEKSQKIDINTKYKVRPVFLTASFFLAQQVKRYYNELTKIITKQIEKRKNTKSQGNIQEPVIKPEQQRKNNIKKQSQYASQIEQEQDKMSKYKSLWDLDNNHFPLFLNVQKFIELVDGLLQNPFLSAVRNQSYSKPTRGLKVENYRWEKRQKKDSESQDEDEKFSNNIEYVDDQIQEKYAAFQKKTKQEQKLEKIRRENRNKRNAERRRLSQKVTYDYFYENFWPFLYDLTKGNIKLKPMTIWTQIYSIIKGDANAYLYPQRCLPLQEYLVAKNNMFLDTSDKRMIYHIFLQYQAIRKINRCYDLLDLTNYILDDFHRNGYQGPQLHYLMIDEIQDLPQAMIYLLSKIFIKGLFYSGDTAQAITKGVSFQFSEIMKIFDKRTIKYPLSLANPNKKQLTISFRSQKKILRLANSLVLTIEQLFPKTIDQLKKQESDFSGPLPMLIKNRDQDILDFILNGNERTISRASGGRPQIQFGCEQLIIVRNQQMKKELPKSLINALCLTIEQSKGLEFDDVVLYDFFKTSPCLYQWKIFRYALTEASQSNDQKFISFDPKAFGEDLSTYSELCSELKMLYTIITRARNILVIYDQIAPEIRFLQEIWAQLGLIKVIEKYSDYQDEQRSGQIHRVVIDQQKHKQRWQRQGLKMYLRGIYEQAIKCYQKSQNKQMLKQSKAHMTANQAQNELKKLNFSINNPDKGKKYPDFPSQKDQKFAIYQKFKQAGQMFQDLKKYKNAGQCFYSGSQYKLALQNFLEAHLYYQAAQCLSQLKRFVQAFEYYKLSNSYFQAVNALLEAQQYQKALKELKKYVGNITLQQRNYIIKKCCQPIFRPIINSIDHQALFNMQSMMHKKFNFNKKNIYEKVMQEPLQSSVQLKEKERMMDDQDQQYQQEENMQPDADDYSGRQFDQFSQYSSFIAQTRDPMELDKSRSFIKSSVVLQSQISYQVKRQIQRQIEIRTRLFRQFLKSNASDIRKQRTQILEQLNLPKIILFLCDLQNNTQDALKYFFMCTLPLSFAMTQKNDINNDTQKRIQFLKTEQVNRQTKQKLFSIKCLVDSLDQSFLSEQNMQFKNHIRAETLVNGLFLQGFWHILPQYLNNKDKANYYYTFMKYEDLSYLVENQFNRNTYKNQMNLIYYTRPKTEYQFFVNLISIEQTLLQFDKMGKSFFLSKKQKAKDSYIHIQLTQQQENQIKLKADKQIQNIYLLVCKAKKQIKVLNGKKHQLKKQFDKEIQEIFELLEKDRKILQEHFQIHESKGTNYYFFQMNRRLLQEKRQLEEDNEELLKQKHQFNLQKNEIQNNIDALQKQIADLHEQHKQQLVWTLQRKNQYLNQQLTQLQEKIDDIQAQWQDHQLKKKKRMPAIKLQLSLLKPFYDHYTHQKKIIDNYEKKNKQLINLIEQQQKIISKNDDKQYLIKQHKRIVDHLTKERKIIKQQKSEQIDKKQRKRFRNCYKIPEKPFIYLNILLKHENEFYLATQFQDMQKKMTGKDIMLDQRVGEHAVIDFLGFLIYAVHNENLLLQIVIDNPYILLNSFKSLYMIVSRIYNPRAYKVLKVLLSLYSCRFLTDCKDFLNIIGEEYILVSSRSLISQRLFEKLNNQFNSTFKAYLIDIEGDIILTKSSYVIQIIKQLFFQKLITVYNISTNRDPVSKQVSQQTLLSKISQFLEQGLATKPKDKKGLLLFTDPNYQYFKEQQEKTIKNLQMTWLRKGKRAMNWNSSFYEKLLRQHYLKFSIEWDQKLMNIIAGLRDFILDCLFAKSIKGNYNFIVLFQQLEKLQNLKENLVKIACANNGKLSIAEEKKMKDEIASIRNILEVWKEKYEFIEKFSKSVKGFRIDKKKIQWHQRKI